MTDYIKNQFNNSTLNQPVFNFTDKPPSHHLTPPPFQSEVFLGREDDLQAIHDRLFNGDNLLLLINGNGGIGKTTLASKYYQQYQDQYQHLAWVLSEKNIANALLAALERPLALNFDGNTPTAERLTLLLTAMAALSKPCLLVIDNANEVEDLNENYQALRRCSQFHILLTTRISEFAKAPSYRIEGLPEDQALVLFKQYYPNHQVSENDLVKQIHAAVGGNTLVIELLAKNLNQINQFETSYSVANLLTDLRSKGLLKLSASEAVTTAYQSQVRLRTETPEAIITAMYNLRALTEEEVALLSVFAVLPAENIAFNTLKDLLGITKNLNPILKTLAQKGWIDYNTSENAFKCSPVVQEIVKNNNPQLFDDCQSLLRALITKLNSEGYNITGSSFKDAALFCRYAESFVASFNECNSDFVMLSERIGVYLEATGNLDKALAFFSYNYDLMQELYAYYPNEVEVINALRISYSNLGSVYTKLSYFELALEMFSESFKLSKELLTTYPADVNFKCAFAASLQHMGEAYNALGNLEQALGFYENNLELSQELYATDPSNIKFKNGLASSYQCMGETYTSLGNLQLALGFFEVFNQLSLELHTAYPTEVDFKNKLAISCDKLGESQAALGNMEKALEFYHGFNQLEQKLHIEYPDRVQYKRDLATSYERLGKTYLALRDLERSLDFFEKYHELTQELYASFPNNAGFESSLAYSCSWLGYTYLSLTDWDHALRFFELFNHVEKKLISAYPTNVRFKNDLALSYLKLGETYFALRNLEYAIELYEEFNCLEKELYTAYPSNIDYKNNLAISYFKMGNVYEQTGDKALASENYRSAYDLWAELAANCPSYVEFKNKLSYVEKILDNL